MENLNKIHLEAQQNFFFFPKEIKVDAVAHTGPLQDWAWQHFMGKGS